GDSTPIHLMTVEAFQLYRRHLARDGVIAVNISNKLFDFEPVVRSVGEATGLNVIRIDSENALDIGVAASGWMLLSPRPEVLEPLADRARPAPASLPRATALWTDDYANVLSVVR